MPAVLNVNPSRIIVDVNVLPPRHIGRGYATKSTGQMGIVSWDGEHVFVNTDSIFALALQPYLLDVSFDQLDRPNISYLLSTGECFIYFYSGLINDYDTLSIGFVTDPIICNDFLLGGNNIVLAYIKNNIPTYRLQSDRYAVEYTLVNRKSYGIKAFGYGQHSNSLQIIVGRWR